MNPLKEGWETVKRFNKPVLIGLVLVQILLLVLVAVVGVSYQIKIIDNVNGIMEPLQELNYEEIEKGEEANEAVMKDSMKKMVLVIQSYEEMIKNLLEMFLLMLGLFLVLNGFIWSIINYVLKKGKWWKYWGKFVGVSLVFIVPFGLISYGTLRSLIGKEMELFGLAVMALMWVFWLLCYFMVVGFCLVGEKWKRLFKKIFLVGVLNIHWMLLGLLVVLVSLLLSLIFVYVSVQSLFLMILSVVVLGLVLVLGKVFLFGIVRNINK